MINHLTTALSLCVTSRNDLWRLNVDGASRAAQRRRGRRLRAAWQYQQSTAMALAAATHHITPRGSKKARAREEEERQTNQAPWRQNPPTHQCSSNCLSKKKMSCRCSTAGTVGGRAEGLPIGKEREEELYSRRALLHRLRDNRWVRRRLGDAKLLMNTTSSKVPRLLRDEENDEDCQQFLRRVFLHAANCNRMLAVQNFGKGQRRFRWRTADWAIRV